MAKTTTTITHDDNKQLEVTVPRKNSLIEFSAVGRLDTLYSDNSRVKHIDIVDLMSTLTPTANKLFKELKDQLGYRSNVASLPKLENTYKSKSRSGATKILKDRGVIKKTGQRSFIVCPYLIVPGPDFQSVIQAKWNSLP